MNIEKAVKEVQDRLELVGERSQGVAKVSLKTLKAANEIVVEGVQGVVAVQTAAAKDLYTAGKQSFDKAVAAGLVAVAKSPVEYLPEGRETIVGAFNDTVETVTKTGEKLVKVAKTGYEGIAASIQGKQIRKPAAKKARKVVAQVAAA
ncbi:MAG: phasin family protein [Gammaproteobacteria bacterium]